MYSTESKRETTRLLIEVNKLIKHNVSRYFEKGELTIPQSMVMHMLMHHGDMKISDLSDKVHLSKSTVSGIVDRLENHGFVERTRNSEDRRTVYVNATKKFVDEHKGLLRKAEESFENLLNSATPEDMEKINEGLYILKRLLQDGKER